MPRAVWDFDAIGTWWRIETAAPLPAGSRDVVDAVIAGFDRAWSRFRADSLVTRLARGAGSVPAPPDAAPMLAVYGELAAATSGAVNPLVGDSLTGLGYDARITLAPGTPRAAPVDWQRRLRVEHGRLHVDGPSPDGAGTIDVGAIGKGRLVDLVLAALPAPVRADAVVDAGGDVAVRGSPQRIGLEHPYDASRAIGVWRVEHAALCASAVNRRAWGDGLHHVLDARTGLPVRTVVATWAVAPEAMRADAAATALFFDGGAELAHRWEVEWVRMLSDGRVEFSPGCGVALFTRTDSVRR